MTSVRSRAILGAALASALILPQAAWAHFIWIKVEPAGKAGASKIQAFFNEDPEPDSTFVKYVSDIRLTVDSQTTPSELTDATRDAVWVGAPPIEVDAERDLGVKTKGDKTYRLYYTARAQTRPVGAKVKERGDKLRVRLVKTEGSPQIEVLFNGEPVDKARIKVYRPAGERAELPTDENGRATVENFEAGETALWANFIDRTPGEVDGKAYTETHYYATLTYTPVEKALGGQSAVEATAFATIPAPAVNSFGGAVLGEWLYIYGGHVGKTHSYSEDTTSKHFRRLNLRDRTTWEELPIQQDLQGLALVSDGKALYRVGGMVARNMTGEDHDLHSVAEFARFDPESKTWTALAPLPEPRSTHDAIVVGRTLYVAGGWHMKGETEESVFLDSAARLQPRQAGRRLEDDPAAVQASGALGRQPRGASLRVGRARRRWYECRPSGRRLRPGFRRLVARPGPPRRRTDGRVRDLGLRRRRSSLLQRFVRSDLPPRRRRRALGGGRRLGDSALDASASARSRSFDPRGRRGFASQQPDA